MRIRLPEELRVLRTLRTPSRIQDFLNDIPMNFADRENLTCRSPLTVLRAERAHCVEGAILAALALRLQGFPPLLLDLEAAEQDFDHVIAPFRIDGHWGALSKTNHAVLRYREPIYRAVRELVLSYFHEYFLDDGRKTLRAYSFPVNLRIFDARSWMTTEEALWYIPEYLSEMPHRKILTHPQNVRLRKADPVERRAGKILEWDENGQKLC